MKTEYDLRLTADAKAASEVKQKQEQIFLDQLPAQANKVIMAPTALGNPSNPLYSKVVTDPAKAKRTDMDYFTVTFEINKILLEGGVDFLKLKDKSFLGGSAFQALYLLPTEFVKKSKVDIVKDLNQEVLTGVMKDPLSVKYESTFSASYAASFLQAIGKPVPMVPKAASSDPAKASTSSAPAKATAKA